jgi:hypothetical protein
MHSRMRIAAISIAALAVLVLALGAQVSFAEKAPKAPKPEQILDKFIEATGGVKAYDKLQNSVVKGALEIPAAGISLDVTAYSARPNLFYSKAESPAIGTFERGTDGKIYWENSTMQGARLLEGAELTDALRDAKFEGMAYWRTLYDTVTFAGVDTVAGSPAYKVTLKPKDGRARTYSFDQKSGLLVKSSTVIQSQMGDVTVEAYPTDYRKVGDVLVSYKTSMKIMGQDRNMTIKSAEYNVAIPDTVFLVPAAVKEIMPK